MKMMVMLTTTTILANILDEGSLVDSAIRNKIVLSRNRTKA